MPVTKSAQKALKQEKRRQLENQKTRNAYKKAVAYFKTHLSDQSLAQAYTKIDRAAKKYLIHKNKASRLKSQLAKLLKEKKVE
ncbi:MAG: 30S ribosomal protein S20 [Candidatus Shapirobacteria bacterium]|nr:30S ribosomal protein S20 [Candidatus Shapirobacteria bacterium]MDD5074087.1 30S ribosomal protein S20 [Candidatus Shapirobacteria bacterium]MDD5481421.1 30S ribosomal protein S20 [Candidatus Shapirobacteria bacterium]